MIDCHCHTRNSPDAPQDAGNTPFALCARAAELGLRALAVTEHCEVNAFYGIEHYNAEPNGYDVYNQNEYFERSMTENAAVKKSAEEKFPRLNFISGIELGQATSDFEIAGKIGSDPRLDFVIASLHRVRGKDDFAFIKYENYDIPALLREYYEEMAELCRWGNFDVLGHLTYTLRYIEGDKGIAVDMRAYDEIIAECMKILAANGKGIELNTSGLRQRYGKTFPTPDYLKLWKDLGGEVLSLGSDSHTPESLGKGLDIGLALAKEAGFRYLCYFKARKPNFIAI